MINLTRLPLAAAAIAIALTAFTASDIALGTVSPAAAQSAPDQGGPAGAAGGRQRFAKMLMGLDLSDDQKNHIRSIMADARTKSKALTDRQAKRDTMRAAFAQIETVLTPAQRTKLHAERDALKAQQAGAAGHS
jgi:Spy/CpxP family protein refolding chaperone